MRRNLFLMFAFLCVSIFAVPSVSAQFTIKIPKITKKENPPPDDKSGSEDRNWEVGTGRTLSQGRAENGLGTGRAPSQRGDKWSNNPIAGHHLDKITKLTTKVEGFNPRKDTRLFQNDDEEYALYAISKKVRDKFFEVNKEIFGDRNSPNNPLDPALDKLSDAVAEKLPGFIPHRNNFAFHNAAYEKMMRGRLRNLSTLTIHQIGLFDRNWIISKNDYGIPVKRYKQGFVWARDSADDHPYCHLYLVDITQDYSGGGTYDSAYALYDGDKLFGCPAGK
ncbi:MAG: hypothetical protein R2747_22575 [Pyrinomonadaceae bacterium]